MPQKRAQGLLAAIRAKGYDWAVDEAQPLARLSVKEQRSYLGLSVTEEEMKATAAAIKAQTALAAFKAITAPPAIDWRNNGGNWTTPVKNQGNCGSCVSFGTCGTIEARIKIALQERVDDARSLRGAPLLLRVRELLQQRVELPAGARLLQEHRRRGGVGVPVHAW